MEWSGPCCSCPASKKKLARGAEDKERAPPGFESMHDIKMRQRSQYDNASSCLSLIVTKPKYPEIDSRESDGAFPPKRLHVSPPSIEIPELSLFGARGL